MSDSKDQKGLVRLMCGEVEVRTVAAYLKPLPNIAQLTDLPNRPIDERLSVIERARPGASLDIVSMLMTKIAKYFKGQITSEEIVLAAESIMWRYNDLTIADIQYFVKEIAGMEIYGNLNVNKVVACFKDFYERRENACADYREKKHNARKALENNALVNFDYDVMKVKAHEPKPEKKKERVVRAKAFKAEDFEKKDL